MEVIKDENILCFEKKLFRVDYIYMREMMLLGVPMGLQNMITAFGGMIVQSIINSFGVIFIAGFTAANKLYGLLESAASSYGYGIASFAGQNKGAGLYQRIHQGFKEASALGIMTAYLMSAVMFFFGKSIMRCFVTGATETIEKMLIIGYEFLVILAIFFPLLYLLYIWRACIQGMGNTIVPMLSSIVQLIMRMLCAILMTKVIGYRGIFWGEVFAWLGADVLLFIAYCVIKNKRKT